MSSSPEEPLVAITIKEETYDGQMAYPPLISGFLVHQLRAGDRLEVIGFAGAYVLPDDPNADHILHLCAGSGSVPNLSIVKDALRRHPRLRHTFAYQQDLAGRDLSPRPGAAARRASRQVAGDSHAHTGGCRVVERRGRAQRPHHAGTSPRCPRTGTEYSGLCMRPGGERGERRAHAAAGTTPSPRFLESMKSHLEALQVPRERIKIEAFG